MIPQDPIGFHKIPQDAIGFQRFPQDSIGFHRNPQESIGIHRSPQESIRIHRGTRGDGTSCGNCAGVMRELCGIAELQVLQKSMSFLQEPNRNPKASIGIHRSPLEFIGIHRNTIIIRRNTQEDYRKPQESWEYIEIHRNLQECMGIHRNSIGTPGNPTGIHGNHPLESCIGTLQESIGIMRNHESP